MNNLKKTTRNKILILKFLGIVLFSMMLNTSVAQNDDKYSESFQTLYSTVFDGDTIADVSMNSVSVIRYKFNNSKDRRMYFLTKRRVEKVYPYYEIALKVMSDLEAKKKSSKKMVYNKYKRKTKRKLISKFQKELVKLTQSEGKILVKMINRNSGKNFNDFIKEYTNPFLVWGYNIAAKKYGYDLKEVYEPEHPKNDFLEKALKSTLPE